MKKVKMTAIILAASVTIGGYGLLGTSCSSAVTSNIVLASSMTTTTQNTSTINTSSSKIEGIATGRGVIGGGNFINLLSAPSGSVVGNVAIGEMVTIDSTNINGYYKVTVSETGDVGYLKISNIQEIYNCQKSTLTSLNEYGSIINVSSVVNVRYGAGLNTDILTTLANGKSVKIIGKQGQWYKINIDGVIGYIYQAYISTNNSTSGAVSQAKESSGAVSQAKESSTSIAVSQTGSVTAQQVLNYAYQFEGYPYVWGGDSPSTGFDCSGFVQYVFAHFGINLPRTTYEQVNCGTPVSLNDIQPGDLVFEIPNAEGPGHVGIYIGNGKMIDAEGIGQGVTISNLYDVVAVRNVL